MGAVKGAKETAIHYHFPSGGQIFYMVVGILCLHTKSGFYTKMDVGVEPDGGFFMKCFQKMLKDEKCVSTAQTRTNCM